MTLWCLHYHFISEIIDPLWDKVKSKMLIIARTNITDYNKITDYIYLSVENIIQVGT